MSPTSWASAEQEAFLQGFYAEFMQCQAKRDYSNFWQPFYENWFAKFPERVITLPNIPGDIKLTEDQNIMVGKAVATRKDQLRNKLRNMWGAKKKARQTKDADGKACSALIANLLQAKEGRKRKPQKIEAYMSLYYENKVRPMVDGAHDVEKKDAMAAAASQGSQASPTLANIMSKAREMFKAESPEVVAEVGRKWNDMVAEMEQTTELKVKDKQYYIDRLAPMLAQFLTGLQEITGWSFSVLMGGPSPENGGRIEACSLHVGVTNVGSMFDQAYPDFNNGIMRPYKDFLDRVPVSTTGVPQAQEPGPKSGIESSPATPPMSQEPGPTSSLESGPPPSCSTGTTSEVAGSVAWVPPPLGSELSSWPALDIDMATLPPLSLDPPVIAATPAALPPMVLDHSAIAAIPDPFTYNYGPQATIDPLDDFLAKYPPEPLPQLLPASNNSFPVTSSGSDNRLAAFVGIVAAASAEVASFAGIEGTSISQTPAIDTTTPQTQTSVVSLAPSIQSNPTTSQPDCPAALPPPPVINTTTPQTNVTAACPAVFLPPPVIDTTTPQTNITVVPAALSTQSDPTTLQPQLPAASPQQNDPPREDGTLSATSPETIELGMIQATSQRRNITDVGPSSAQSAPQEPSNADTGASSVQHPQTDPTLSSVPLATGKRSRQPSKRNQVANSIGTEAGAPNKRLAASGTVKTSRAKKRKTM